LTVPVELVVTVAVKTTLLPNTCAETGLAPRLVVLAVFPVTEYAMAALVDTA
jgi:hypothetical protein